MPEPAETLSLFAELSVALAGFSGIVIILGRRQSGQLSRLDRRRLTNLFISVLVTLLTSLSALTLLHAELSEMIVWRVASAAWAFAIAILMAQDWRRLRALSESERTLVHWQLLVLFWASLILVALLQVANSVHLHALWPLLVALILSLLSAFQQFMLLLYAGFRAA